MSSSPSPSSSAVTIPTPGKSILKKPPPPPQSFFSLGRLSKLLPTQTTPSDDSNDEKTLKRAHFILPELTTVYPIYAANPPSTPLLKDEKRTIEEREAERRKRVVRRNSVATDSSSPEDTWWSLPQVESFYRECCIGREETPDHAISACYQHARHLHPRSVDFSGVQLTIGSASVLSDVFTIEWGLRKLIFKECDLDEHILKPLLHSLLIPGSLTYLSVASNRRLKAPGFKVIGAYLHKAKGLQFLDVAQNTMDKKSIEYIAAALPQAPEPGLISLRFDDCALKPQVLDALAHAVRISSLRNISLRYNKINATGAVAVALMIKDYPDRFPNNGSAPSSTVTSPISGSSVSSLLSPPSTPTIPSSPSPNLPLPPPPPRPGPVLPPPRHPAAGPPTTYTPYIPRSKRAAVAAANPSNTNPLSLSGQPVPIIASSAQGGVTARHSVPPTTNGQHLDHGHSVALLDKVRALDALPRLGALRTLDLRGNDIRSGITYIAQVLKRNRTLKVLNLSENKLDVQGLVAVAEALKYNSCLETLDLSKNPCCGPGLEGVQSLRTAFTLNSALKRLFMASTGLTSTGAIALAEFLPESTSLLHLDLTMNNLDVAGVMALSSGLKANHVMRCLDLNIPPSDEQLASMCREILNTCVRNTEEAERASQAAKSDTISGRGQGKGVWVMIEESELAKTLREDDKKKVEAQVPDANSLTSNGEDRTTDLDSVSVTQEVALNVLEAAKSCKKELEDTLSGIPSASSSPTGTPDANEELIARSKETLKALSSLIEGTEDPMKLEELFTLNDEITGLTARFNEPRATLKGLGIHIEEHTNGSTNGHIPPIQTDLDQSDDDEPVTPRADKGKQRAEPEPEEPQLVLTPTVGRSEQEFEDSEVDQDAEQCIEGKMTLDNSSRSWVAEEGEIFRKGAVLLTPEEMETEYDSEELRKELLDAMVERPPPRTVHDTFEDTIPSDSPTPSSLSSPVAEKPPPRPYIRRSRSSSSTTSSPATPTQEVPTLPTIPDSK
ncbi:hypothetical protein BDY19DRAFT_986247 [Irpex rosettiformis]|uniref:Uncharacterized protein n=1 Tax=Irpex rosettiformis TaxID=378272 RepID=A0ACB8TYR0_9APHY|nr:hypothetical protein BDY19DRAFT_986247 [Irpex rosettiformis]